MARFFSFLRSVFLRLALLALVVLVFAAFYMDAWLIEKLNAKQWTVPATVYARPLEVYAGQVLSQEAVVNELKAAGYRSMMGRQAGTFTVAGNTLTVHLRPFRFWDGLQPAQSVSLTFAGDRITAVRSSRGRAADVRLEPMEIGRIHTETQEDRLLVRLQDVPQHLVDALIITEDRYFYSHHGVSPRAIVRALFVNTREGKVVEGASTLTQQLIKNFFLESSRSYSRKLMEILLAVLLEIHVDKKAILGAYINEVFVLQDGAKAIHGFGLASQYLFGLPVSSLSVEQGALLIAMLKGPSYYNPLRFPERALERRNLVLKLMAREGRLGAREAEIAMSKPLGLLDRKEMLASYPAYLDVVRRQLRRDYSDESLRLDGLRIFSNMDPQWQWRSQRELQQGIMQLESRYAAKASGIDGAVVAVDHATGNLLAVVGGKASRHSGFNRALDAKRPIGSLVKPAIYLAALGGGYTLSSQISDAEFSMKTHNGTWRPQNFDRQYHGDVPLYLALAKSYNVAAVRLGMTLGIGQVSKTLGRLGVEEALPQLPSLLLGAVELSPMQVAQAYSTIANAGFYTPLKSIREITDGKGRVLKRYPLRLEQRFSPDVMYLLDFALQQVIREGTGSAVREQFRPGVRPAGKTGTTNDQRDSWFAGYDANKSVVVWLGQDDNRPLPVTGGSGALPVWAGVIAGNTAIEGRANVPDNVRMIWIDRHSGLLSAEGCPDAMLIPYTAGTEPTESVACATTSHKVMNWFEKWFQ